MQYAYWRHVPSGCVYAVAIDADGMVVAASDDEISAWERHADPSEHDLGLENLEWITTYPDQFEPCEKLD